jgi:hypothetical protein
LETVDFSVSDIRAIKEGQQVEKREPGDELKIEFPEQLAVLEDMVSLAEVPSFGRRPIQFAFSPLHLDPHLDPECRGW